MEISDLQTRVQMYNVYYGRALFIHLFM